MNSFRFQKIQDRYLSEVERQLQKHLQESSFKVCSEIAQYHLNTGGKRIRALLTLGVYEALEKDPHEAISLACAVEMVHNATLVHDDLQDGDEVRRNFPTVWKKYSIPQAINGGDAMFQFALEILMKWSVSAETKVRLTEIFTRAILSVVEGQAQEVLLREKLEPTIEDYLKVARKKTSGLFELPTHAALTALNCGVDEIAAAVSLASRLGVLFQIQDDLLDLYGDKGRGIRAADICEGKVSFLVAYAYEQASDRDWKELQKILRKPRQETLESDIVQALALFEKVGAREQAQERIKQMFREIQSSQLACSNLQSLLCDSCFLFADPNSAFKKTSACKESGIKIALRMGT